MLGCEEFVHIIDTSGDKAVGVFVGAGWRMVKGGEVERWEVNAIFNMVTLRFPLRYVQAVE